MKEIHDAIESFGEMNAEQQSNFDDFLEKLVFHSQKKWFSISTIQKKMKISPEVIQSVLIVAQVKGRAISKIDKDGVLRFKITSNPKEHISFLKQEIKMYQSKIDFLNQRIQKFKAVEKGK